MDTATWLGGGIVGIAGVLKLIRPRTAGTFARRLRLPGSAGAIRLIAVVELLAGAALLTSAGPVVLAGVSALEALFLAVLALHRVRTGERTVSCGCFGSSTAIPVAPHALALGIAQTATATAALAGRPSLADVVVASSVSEALLLLALLIVALMLLVGVSTFASERPGPPMRLGAPGSVIDVLSVLPTTSREGDR